MLSNTDSPSATLPGSGKARSRCSWSAEERAEWIRLLEASGQTLAEFCRGNDLPESTVSLWRRQLRESQIDSADDAGFVEVALPPMPASGDPVATAVVVVHLPGNVRIEAVAGTDVTWLGELLQVLRSS